MGWIKTFEDEEKEIWECDICDNPEHTLIRKKEKKLKCHKCNVEIDKEQEGWYLLYKVSKTGKKYRKTYFCDFICVMDWLNSVDLQSRNIFH